MNESTEHERPAHEAGAMPPKGGQTRRVIEAASEKTGMAGVAMKEALDSLRLQLAGGMSRASEYLATQGPSRDATAPPNRMAESLDRAANYLRSTPVEQMSEDAADVVRQHPLESIGAALVAGALVGAALKRRR